MFALDLFNTDHERRLTEGAVDTLEQRRIDDLAMKMDDLVARAKKATTPEVKQALMKEFQKCKDERDSYYKLNTEGQVTPTATGLRHHAKPENYGGYQPEPELKGLNKTLTKNLEKGMGIEFKRAKKFGGGIEVDEEVADSYNTKQVKVFKDKSGKPIGEIGFDLDASPGNDDWYCWHYATGYNVLGFENAAEATRELKYVHKHPEAVSEAGIPGNVPVEKIPGKEDLLKGKGRKYYEDQKKNSKEVSQKHIADPKIDQLLTKAHRERPKAKSDAEALAMKILDREQQDVERLSKENEREDRMIAKLANLEQNLQQQIDTLRQATDLNEDQRLHVGDPVIVTGPNEFEGKTGEISEFSPSGKFVVVNLYNHGEHSMHLSDVKYNEYADQQDDWYDEEDYVEEDQGDGQVAIKAADDAVVDTMDEAAVNPQFINNQVTKLLARATQTGNFDPLPQLLAPLMKQYNLTLQQIDAMVSGGLKKAASEYGVTMKEGWSDAIVAQRTGQPRTPYSVYIKGKKWKDFANDDLARAVMDRLKAKFKADGRDPETITIAPTDIPEGVAEVADQTKKVFKDKAGKPVGEIGIDPESSPGNGEWYVYHYATGYSVVGFDSAAEAKRELMYVHKHPDAVEGHPSTKEQGVAEGGFGRDEEFLSRERNAGLEHETNNIQIAINGKPWKVMPGKGYADSAEERAYLEGMKRWAEKKSAATGKKWTVYLTGANISEAVTDYSKRRQRERDVDAGKPVPKQRTSKMTDYQKKRAQDKKDMELGEDQDTSGVESAIIRRIMVAHTDLLQQFGPEKVMQAAEEVAYNVGDVDEIGTSDVSAYVHEVKQILGAV